MKVNGISPNKVVNLYGIRNKKDVQGKNSVSTGDRLEISDIGKSLSSFSVQKNVIPDEKKVKAIKDKIANGKYKVSPEDIAKSLMEIMEGKES